MEAKIPLRVIPLSLLPRPAQNLIRGTLQETKNIPLFFFLKVVVPDKYQ